MSGFTIASLKNAVDELRVQYYPKNETEKRVYEALSSKNWGASSTLLGDIATDSFNFEKYGIIMKTLWGLLESPGTSWKQLFKSLSLLEFLIKNGAERVIEEARDHMRLIRSLQDYNYYEGNADKGSGVREKSKQVIDLLGNNELIREEREKARRLREKFVGISSDASGYGGGGYGGSSYGGSGSYGGSSGSYGGSSGGGYGNSGIGSNSGYGGRYDSGSSYSSRNGAGTTGRYDDYDASHRTGDRMGGGSYDSNKPSRFSDNPPDRTPSYEEEPASTRRASAGTGKLKINLKTNAAASASSHQPAAQPAAAPAPAVDFFNSSDDFFGSPASAPAPASAAASHHSFDAFTSAPPLPAAHNQFDAFASAPAPAPAPSAGFDAFGFQPTAAMPPQHHAPAPAFDVFAAPAAPPAPAPTSMNVMGGQQAGRPVGLPGMAGSGGYAPHHNQAPAAYDQWKSPAANNADADFGDFEVAAPRAAAAVKPAAAASGDKWGALNNLVNLSNISTNDTPKQSSGGSIGSTDHRAQNSFAGLDGFSKNQQSMSTRPPPSMSSMGSNGGAPAPSAMMYRGAPQQPGYGAPPAQGGYPMGGMMPPQQPQYGYPPMGGAPQGGFPGYPPQQPQGYPQGFPQQGYPQQGGFPQQQQQQHAAFNQFGAFK